MDEIMNINGIDCYEKDGIVYLKSWENLGFGTSAERPDFIPENIFYRLAMKAKNEAAEAFQERVYRGTGLLDIFVRKYRRASRAR